MSAALCWFAVGALTFEGVVAVAWYIHEPAWRRASTGWFLLFLLVRPLFIGFWIWEAIHA